MDPKSTHLWFFVSRFFIFFFCEMGRQIVTTWKTGCSFLQNSCLIFTTLHFQRTLSMNCQQTASSAEKNGCTFSTKFGCVSFERRGWNLFSSLIFNVRLPLWKQLVHESARIFLEYRQSVQYPHDSGAHLQVLIHEGRNAGSSGVQMDAQDKDSLNGHAYGRNRKFGPM